eukprot:3992955-Amphidinium_carterae.1
MELGGTAQAARLTTSVFEHCAMDARWLQDPEFLCHKGGRAGSLSPLRSPSLGKVSNTNSPPRRIRRS